uniref:Uncharacterized protein n=1 Tax=Glossina palpalis gambiensis TaxID=67801 RepID=A0A1B0BZP8_9MUSC
MNWPFLEFILLPSSSSDSEISESELSSEIASPCMGFIVIVKAESSQRAIDTPLKRITENTQTSIMSVVGCELPAANIESIYSCTNLCDQWSVILIGVLVRHAVVTWHVRKFCYLNKGLATLSVPIISTPSLLMLVLMSKVVERVSSPSISISSWSGFNEGNTITLQVSKLCNSAEMRSPIRLITLTLTVPKICTPRFISGYVTKLFELPNKVKSKKLWMILVCIHKKKSEKNGTVNNKSNSFLKYLKLRNLGFFPVGLLNFFDYGQKLFWLD